MNSTDEVIEMLTGIDKISEVAEVRTFEAEYSGVGAVEIKIYDHGSNDSSGRYRVTARPVETGSVATTNAEASIELAIATTRWSYLETLAQDLQNEIDRRS